MKNSKLLKENQNSKCPNCGSIAVQEILSSSNQSEKTFVWYICNHCRLRFLDEVDGV